VTRRQARWAERSCHAPELLWLGQDKMFWSVSAGDLASVGPRWDCVAVCLCFSLAVYWS
jgi:hypothetical protein